MKHPDLFGGDTEIPERKVLRKEKMLDVWARVANYRRAKEGENCCGDCKFIKGFRQSKTWYKCLNLGVTGSAASYIRVGHTCDNWTARMPDTTQS